MSSPNTGEKPYLLGRKHGSRSTYNDGCHCRRCTRANTRYQAKRRHLGEIGKNGSHGLSGYINYGCRCPTCKAAKSESNAAYAAAHPKRKVS